jgi:hypothetical protein
MLDINRVPFITVQRYGENNPTLHLQFIYNLSTCVVLTMKIRVTATINIIKVKVKQSHYSPGVAQRVPGS